jgi:electron transfer flavoprotein beta subunit
VLESLGLDIAPRLKVERVDAPTERAGGVIVGSVDELLEKLRNEAKVLWRLLYAVKRIHNAK